MLGALRVKQKPQPVSTKVRAAGAPLPRILLNLGLIVVPLAMVFLFYRLQFAGLIVPDAMDFAQIARNLFQGKGFTTSILRPLALAGSNPFSQPDVTHGPLYPLLLALAFGMLGAKDSVVAAVSSLCYVLTVPVLFALGVRLFNFRVAMITCLTFMVNALALEYATSGVNYSLCILLVTCALYCHHRIFSSEQPMPRRWLVATGLCAGLIYLSDPLLALVGPLLLFHVVLVRRGSRLQTALYAAVPFLILSLPWMIRNGMMGHNPVFGLVSRETVMVSEAYRGFDAYRMLPDEILRGTGVLNAVVKKVLFGAGEIINAFPQITTSWLLSFFLPGLLFRFDRSDLNEARRSVLWCVLGVFITCLVFHLQMPFFVTVVPVMLLFAVAFLLHLVEGAQFNRQARVITWTIITTAITLPLLYDFIFVGKGAPWKTARVARAIKETSERTDVVLTDQPWAVAWFGERPAIWIPHNAPTTSELTNRFKNVNWVMLSEDCRGYEPDWQLLYTAMLQGNLTYQNARVQKINQAPVPLNPWGAFKEPLKDFVVAPVGQEDLTIGVAVRPKTKRM